MGLTELAELHYGMGRHRIFLSPDDYMAYNRVGLVILLVPESRTVYLINIFLFFFFSQAFYVDVIFYNCALASIKLQVLLQYFRLFDVRLGMRKVLVAVTVVVCIWGAFTVLSATLSCIPVAAFWDHSIEGRCFPIVEMAYTHAAGESRWISP